MTSETQSCLYTRLVSPSHARRDLQGTQGEQMDVGLPSTLLLPILRSIRKSVQEIRDVLSTIELRLVGSSLLVVYEGDWDRAEMGVQWLSRQPTSTISNKDQRTEEENYEGADMGVGGVGDAEGMDEEEGDDTDTDTSEGDSEDGGSDLPCVVRLIDFAHTRLKRGQGPDPGVLKGLETVVNLLDGRIASVECMI
jgi:inositol-polyphosphate multikinase